MHTKQQTAGPATVCVSTGESKVLDHGLGQDNGLEASAWHRTGL